MLTWPKFHLSSSNGSGVMKTFVQEVYTSPIVPVAAGLEKTDFYQLKCIVEQ